jgi:hypothetical protein
LLYAVRDGNVQFCLSRIGYLSAALSLPSSHRGTANYTQHIKIAKKIIKMLKNGMCCCSRNIGTFHLKRNRYRFGRAIERFCVPAVNEYAYVPGFLGWPCPLRRPDPRLRERIKPGSVFHIQEYTAQNLGGVPDSGRKNGVACRLKPVQAYTPTQIDTPRPPGPDVHCYCTSYLLAVGHIYRVFAGSLSSRPLSLHALSHTSKSDHE